MTDTKLDVAQRVAAIYDLRGRLIDAIMDTARGVTDEEIQDAWLFVCEQEHVKPKVGTSETEPEPEPLYAVLEDDIYQVAEDMNLPDGSITPEIVAKVREAYRNFDFTEHHQFIQEQLEECGLEEREEEPVEKKKARTAGRQFRPTSKKGEI